MTRKIPRLLPHDAPASHREMNRTIRKQARTEQPVTQDEFDAALEALLEESAPGTLLAVAGVYEALSEAWNNEIIARAKADRE